jgi:molybdenum cofactor biosynthesis protein B
VSESSQSHKREAPTQVGFTLIMCSTSRFARLEKGGQVEDPSGDLVIQKLSEAGHRIVSRVLVPDDEGMIEKAVIDALSGGNSDAVVVCGGTGIAPEDVTIETIAPVLEKNLPGFGEMFRKLSYDSIGSAAILSRALAGIVKGKAVFCIPGSEDAVRLCLDKLILPEAGHIVKHARERHD